MKTRQIYKQGFEKPAMTEIRIEAHGKGGTIGMTCVQNLAAQIEGFKAAETPQEVYDRFMTVCGYCRCCIDAGFLDAKSGDELMQLASMLAGIEQARAEQQAAGGKA